MAKPLSIKDARGEMIELWHGGYGPEEVAGQLTSAERKKLGKFLQPTPKWNERVTPATVLFILAMTVLSLVVGAIVAFVNSSTSLPPLVAPLVFGWPLGILAGLFIRHQQRRLAKTQAYVAALLEMNRCPGCFYQINGLMKHDDGCIVCPECGGAWQPVATESRDHWSRGT